MSRFFFHVIDGKFLIDDEGTECRGISDVREQAIATAGAILKDAARDFPPGTEWQMHVTDEAKVTVFRLRFSMEEPGLQAAPPLSVARAI